MAEHCNGPILYYKGIYMYKALLQTIIHNDFCFYNKIGKMDLIKVILVYQLAWFSVCVIFFLI